ncbi:MAG: hypothetical protein AABW72_00905 [archaeon]
MQIVYSSDFLLHDTGNHPENKERLISILNAIENHGFDPEDFKQPMKTSEVDLLLVHAQEHIGKLKYLSEKGVAFGDNIFHENTFNIALEACGAALKAAKLCKRDFAFALARPPGHHAGKNFFEGFCYLNNIAYAVRRCLSDKDFNKVLILDFDVHHGQGTQDIFSFDQDVFYLSLHQDPLTIYPFKYYAAKSKNIRNVILKPGTDDKTYLEILRKNFLECVDSFNPDVIAISAGFDIYYKDTMVGNQLQIKDTKTFYEIGKIINESSGTKKFAVLEGGYSLPDLGQNVFNFLNAFV